MNEEKKLVSVVVPVYNEAAMVDEVYRRVREVFRPLEKYAFELVFFDDGSTDGTRQAIEKLCRECDEVKGVFYTKNFGYLKNTFYCVKQAKGDCAVILHADLQNPPELIPEFLEKWEQGAQVVWGVKNKSRENRFVYFLRSVFYFLMRKFFGVDLPPHATDFELIDKSLIDVLKEIETTDPFLRGMVREYGTRIEYVTYTQEVRGKGKSKFNLDKYYDFAICGVTQYSRVVPRRVIGVCALGMLVMIVEFFAGLLPQLGRMSWAEVSEALMLRAIFLVVCLLVVLVCIMFEYMIAVANNGTRKPLVVEEKRIKY